MPGKQSIYCPVSPSSPGWRTVAFVVALWGAGLGQAAESPQVSIKFAEIDLSITRLSTEELIDRLQEESQHKVPFPGSSDTSKGYSTVAPALSWGFPPVARPPFLQENMRPPLPSPVMAELVKRGLTALPALLEHLTDARPTRIIHQPPNFGIVSFGDHYDPRHAEPSRQPPGANTVTREGEHSLNAPYAQTVGELCLRAVNHIVNRREKLPGYFIGHVSVISSPTKYPGLAAAVRSDWAGLSAAEHEQSLRTDALETSPRGLPTNHSRGALARLLFYYPAAGQEVAAILLRRELIPHGAMPSQLTGQVGPYWQRELLEIELTPFHWDGLDPQLYEVFQKATQVTGGDWLALTCARMLARKGRDDEFREFFSKRLAENEKALSRPGLGQGDRMTLTQVNEDYRVFLQTL